MSVNSLLLLLIWPFASFLSLFRGKIDIEFRNVFWFLCVFFGFGFVLKGDVGDSYRYAEELKEINFKIKLGFSFIDLLSLIYTQYSDPFSPIVTFIIAYFTPDYRFLFGIYALFFGYFYSSNIFIILNNLNKDISTKLKYLIFAYLLLILPIWEINGVRMWTGFHAVFYGLLKSKNSLLDRAYILFVPPFFHSSFFIFSAIYLVAFLGQKYISLKLIRIIFLLSSFVVYTGFRFTFEQTAFIGDLGSGGSELLEGKTSAYNNEYDLELEQSSWFLNWSAEFSRQINLILAVGLFIFIRTDKYNIFGSISSRELFTIGSIVSLIALHPSISSGRFLVWITFIGSYIFIQEYESRKGIFYYLLEIAIVIFILFILVIKIRFGFEFFNYGFFLGNIFSIYFLGNDISMLDFYYALFGKYSS